MGVNPTTGDVRWLSDPSELAADEVLVYGTEVEAQRLGDGIRALNRDERRKAKRKAQRAARKANR